MMITEMAGNKSATPLLVLTNLLKTMDRVGTPGINVNSKLNYLVDALPPGAKSIDHFSLSQKVSQRENLID